MQKIKEQLHGHRVVVEPASPPDPDRVVIVVDEQRYPARLDDELGWSCSALPFRGHASPLALAEALAASLSAGGETDGEEG